MAAPLYQMLFGETVGKMSDNLTSVFLAVSVVTLALGYLSKTILQQSTSDPNVVSWRFKENDVWHTMKHSSL